VDKNPEAFGFNLFHFECRKTTAVCDHGLFRFADLRKRTSANTLLKAALIEAASERLLLVPAVSCAFPLCDQPFLVAKLLEL